MSQQVLKSEYAQAAIRKRVSDYISDALAAKVIPWRRTPAAEGLPSNVATRKTFCGVNLLLLQILSHYATYQSRWWGTVQNWNDLGGVLQLDAQPIRAVRYEPVPSVSPSEFRPRNLVVYNHDHVEGVELPRNTMKDTKPDWSVAERLIARTGAKIHFVHWSIAEYHRPPVDHIILSHKCLFEADPAAGLPGYYDSLFHEMMHWSEARLCWWPQKWDANTLYAINELRAEMGAGWLATELGLPNSSMMQNHLKYLDQWLTIMKQDPGMIFTVAMGACVGVDYLLNFIGRAIERDNMVSEWVA